MDTTKHPNTCTLLDSVRHALGNDLVAVYLYGSAVDGGLRPDSDIDLLVISRAPLSASARPTLVERLLGLSAYPTRAGGPRPLEVTLVVLADIRPWRYPPRRDLVFGEWLRPSLEAGDIEPPAFDPDLTLLLASARQNSQALVGPAAQQLLEAIPLADLHRAVIDSLPALLASVKGDERNVLLTLARMWYTLATGHITSKDQAARWLTDHLPATHRAVLELARLGYLGERVDDWRQHAQAVEAFVAHARSVIEYFGRDRADEPLSPGEQR